MKNQIILFTSVKGGVGKTQLCASAATFLVEQGIPVIVIDIDVQQSISRHRKRDLDAHPSADVPWNVEFLDTRDIDSARNMISNAKKLPCCILIDCPGNITDASLNVIYEAADLAIIPFELNADSVDATVLFAELFKTRFQAKMYFIPNKVSAVFELRGEPRKAREDAIQGLEKSHLGMITPDIKLTTNMNGYSTIETYNREKRAAVRNAFAPIVRHIQHLK